MPFFFLICPNAIRTNWVCMLNDEFLDQCRLLGDLPADEALAALVAEKGEAEARRLFDLLIRRIEMPLDELPGSLRGFLASTDRLPDWADPHKVDLAHELFLDHGPKFLVFLYYKSLPLLYSCANGAQVLVRTSRLTNDTQDLTIFTRRIAETGQFLLEVMSRGNLQPGRPGIQAIQKVRLIHASIRRFLPKADWDPAWGTPINQEDMAVTLMTFSISMIDALGQFDIPEREERLETFLHTWTAIGQLLGIREELLPRTLPEAQSLIDRILARQSKASEAGTLLTNALLDFAESVLPDRFDALPKHLMQHLIGPERAQMLGVSPANGCLAFLLPEALRTYFRISERLEDRIEQPLGVFLDLLARKTAEGMVGYFDKHKGRAFHIPAALEASFLPPSDT